MGLINKEELLKKIGEHKITDSMKPFDLERVAVYEWTKHDLYDIIYNFPTVDGKWHWIPVERKLPKENETVIVTDHDEWVDLAFYDGLRWWYRDGSQETDGVTAWMPLPEVYQGEDDGES